jgi:hypothetical protein
MMNSSRRGFLKAIGAAASALIVPGYGAIVRAVAEAFFFGGAGVD